MASEQILTAIVVMCFFPIGLKCISWDGMILQGFGKWMDKTTDKLPVWIRKPLWTCPRCMVPWWGGCAALLLTVGPWWIAWVPLVVTAVGLQETLDK